jgi:hypothetical protein
MRPIQQSARPFLFPHSSAVITAITGSGTTRQVTISLGSATGQIRLRLANSIGIADNVGALVANIPVVSPVYNRPLVVADVPEGVSRAEAEVVRSYR